MTAVVVLLLNIFFNINHLSPNSSRKSWQISLPGLVFLLQDACQGRLTASRLVKISGEKTHPLHLLDAKQSQKDGESDQIQFEVNVGKTMP